MAGDFHNHTFLTDGDCDEEMVIAQAFHFGLEWIANSEHGGAFNRMPWGMPWSSAIKILGSPPAGKMWRWQSLWQYSYPVVAEARATYPGRIIMQGYEWNVPTHEHASVGIVGKDEDGGLAIARHEYLFDADDTGTEADTTLGVSGKKMENSHEKALAGVKWLAEHFPMSSYVVLNHPSRQLRYSIADIRDFNDAAPSVAFGFEGIPGHQKAANRGGYDRGPFKDEEGKDITGKARTYGGADSMIAEVGGTWDALLGEGRRFFTFVNSDFHDPNYDFWPGEYAKDFAYVEDIDHDGIFSPVELLQALRSGNSYVAMGNLINGLEFSAENGRDKVGMGSTLSVDQQDEVEITIRFRTPAPTINKRGGTTTVNHIDLIAGEMHGKIDKYLNDKITLNPHYNEDANKTAKVIASFTEKDFRADGDGWNKVVYHINTEGRDMYFRLRGTNLGCDVPGETDENCNPLSDVHMSPNTELKADADLWFYSNPLFVKTSRRFALGSTLDAISLLGS